MSNPRQKPTRDHFIYEEISTEESEAIQHLEDGFKILARMIVRAIIQEVHRQIKTFPEVQQQTLLSASDSLGQPKKLTYSVREVAELLGLGRSSVYEAVKTKRIPSIYFGRKIFIPCVALKKMLNDSDSSI
jgi:excisionase family DNA binding protein